MLEKNGVFQMSLSNRVLPRDLSAPAEQVDELPIPYFERADYEGIPQVTPDWEGFRTFS